MPPRKPDPAQLKKLRETGSKWKAAAQGATDISSAKPAHEEQKSTVLEKTNLSPPNTAPLKDLSAQRLINKAYQSPSNHPPSKELEAKPNLEPSLNPESQAAHDIIEPVAKQIEKNDVAPE